MRKLGEFLRERVMAGVLEYRGGKERRVKVPPTMEQARRFLMVYRIAAWGTAIAAAVCLWECRVDLNGGLDGGVSCIFLMAGAVGVDLVLAVLWCVRLWWFEETVAQRWRNAAPLWIVASTVICVLVLVVCGVPFRAAFWQSRPALERAVAEVRADRAKGKAPRTVGVLPIREIDIDGAMATVHVDGADVDWGSPPALEFGPEADIRLMFGGRTLIALGHDWFRVEMHVPP